MLEAVLLLVSLAAGQGEALVLSYPHEPGLEAVEVQWNGRTLPAGRRGEEWVSVLGIDLDAEAGTRTAQVTFRYSDGRVRERRETIVVGEREFPTTRLTVEPKYVELSPEDQARAAREAEEIKEIYSTLTPEVYWSEPFLTPVEGVTGGRNFGHRRVFNGQPRAPHSGADLRAAKGTPIHASNRGRVVLAKELFFSGNAVLIDHGLGVYSAYLHLDRIDVQPGQMVERGEVIGLSGATGRVTGPHLHWGVRVLDARVDPFSLLGAGQ
ncbi:MAG TPA: M23 family metallopeptidase [Gammaproteobacteria bacterium]